jgi:Asp-tRNA(Asn)/Glu-tRNA(Gln) amidotransferase A subunit family amidase
VTTPWLGDACSLVEAFRRGERTPAEEVAACMAAIEASDLNAIAHLDAEVALATATSADVTLPFGGLPIGVKQLEPVAGWPYTEGSLVFADRVAHRSATMVERLTGAGAVPLAQATASEFGGLNISVNRLNGVTHNPWRPGRSCGGSSGGSASAVAGGLLPLATGGDGGGSIRIPAGYTGVLGLKSTYGRIPRGPRTRLRPHTVVLGCLARSVRDVARYLDVCAGPDLRDPTSLPAPASSYEAALGTVDLGGLRVAVDPSLGGIPLAPGVAEVVEDAAAALIAEVGLRRVDVPVRLPRMGLQWVMGNVASLLGDLDERWPRCADLLTDEVRAGITLSRSLYNLEVAAAAEVERIDANEAMAEVLSTVDLVICATNPDPAFPAEAPLSDDSNALFSWATSSPLGRRVTAGALAAARVGTGAWPGLPSALVGAASARFASLLDMGALTMPANLYGCPAVSIPAGTVDGLPIGMQVLARHHAEDVLLDIALAVERSRPWPLVAPGAPR